VKDEARDLLVLPLEKRAQVLKHAHDEMGHFGVKKTGQILGRNFTWPRVKEDITLHVKSCAGCQHKRRVTVFDRVPIKPFSDRPTKSFEVISIDAYGPINPPSSSGHRYVLGIICMQSRWIECYPMKSLKPSEVLDNLMKFFAYAGFCKTLIADNATNFVSKLNKLLYDRLGIELRTSTPYHSEGNATIERYWGTFRSMITHVVNGDKPREWHKAIPFLLAAYRGMRNETTGATPYMLVHGHETRTVLDVLFETWTGQGVDRSNMPKLNKDEARYYMQLKENLEIAQEAASAAQKLHEDKYISRYNLRSKEKDFSVDDQVLILQPDSSSKVKWKWIGPGKVVEKHSPHSYMIQLDDGSVRLLHSNKLRFYNARVNNVSVLDDRDCDFGEVVECPVLADKTELEDDISKLDLSHLLPEQAEQVKCLIRKYSGIFSNLPGQCRPDIIKHKIVLNDDFCPKKQKPYQLPEVLKPIIDKQIDDLLKLGVIRESNSDICHPIVCVKKKTGDIRMCIDYRFINKFTKFDGYTLKRIDDIVKKVSKSNFLTSLDATQGYYQILMEEESIPYTSFVTHRGQFECVKMSFGLRCSSQSYQRAIDKILRPVSDCAEAYIDDVCCHTEGTFEEHLVQLSRVFDEIAKSGMTLKLAKCNFCKPELLFLGFMVGQNSIAPNPSKVQILIDLKEPETKKEVRSVLAMFRFYCHLIPRFSEICIPLSDLTAKSKPRVVKLNDEQRVAFNKLKQALIESARVYAPDYSKKFVITCDASERAVAATLSQTDQNGKERPVAFASAKLTETQTRWSAIEREAYACLFALKAFDVYIFGSEIDLVTDHNPLTFLANCTPKSPKLERWILGLQRWCLNIKHKPGKENVVADFFTRY
ncbi:MAG: RNase H-like domain-containing protein, partial [Candidatus Nitrosopolaris sp.]